MAIVAALEAAGQTNVSIRWESNVAPGRHNQAGAMGRYVFTSDQHPTVTVLGTSSRRALAAVAKLATTAADAFCRDQGAQP